MGQFFASVERQAFQYALMATSCPDDALELVQESMMALMKNYNHKPSNEWKPLFFRVLNNKITDFYRRNHLIKRWFLQSTSKDDEKASLLEDYVKDTGNNPDKQLEKKQMMHQVEHCLQSLSSKQRQAFLLRAWQGFNIEETALAMQCSKGSVKVHYSRAISKLKTLMSEYYKS